MRTKLPIVIAFLFATALPAQGQDQNGTSENSKGLAAMLRQHPRSDADGDGVLTRAEFDAYRGEFLRIKRTHPNVSYGDHEKQVFDLWQAKSKDGKPTPLAIFIHGGGFRGGDKGKSDGVPVKLYLDAGVSYASLNYRLTDVGPYPMQHHDCARAIQFIRHNAKKWNIDPARIASSGGSAGAGITLWLGFHDDLADPKSSDPVARQSSGILAAAIHNGQSTYDIHEFRKIFNFPELKMHEALYPFYQVKDEAGWDSGRVKKLMADASAITHFDQDDRVPVYASYDSLGPGRITAKTNPSAWVHHIKLGRHLKEQMDKYNIECHVIGGQKQKAEGYIDSHDFLIQKLTAAE